MTIGLLTLHIQLPGCTSLKEKRHRLKPLLARLHREFNISAAEIDRLDAWQEAVICLALVSNDHGFTQRTLQNILRWIETHWPDVLVVENKTEIL
jgi:uncharacterized protein YlxP (DUF503 family)